MRAASALIARGLRAAAGDGGGGGGDAEAPLAAAAPAAQAKATSGAVERSELRYAAARKWQARHARRRSGPQSAARKGARGGFG